MYDGGNSHQQPIFANGGFFVATSNARTLRFFREVSIGSEFHNGQQSVMAPLLVHHYFNGMEISVLGDRFANGPLLGLTEAKRVPSDWIVAHASWTDNLQNKRLKLRALGEYEPSCPQQIVPLATACNSKWEIAI